MAEESGEEIRVDEKLKTKTFINKDGTIGRASNVQDESRDHNKCINMVEKSCVKGFLFLFYIFKAGTSQKTFLYLA